VLAGRESVVDGADMADWRRCWSMDEAGEDDLDTAGVEDGVRGEVAQGGAVENNAEG
jgi:hypothetical protein